LKNIARKEDTGNNRSIARYPEEENRGKKDGQVNLKLRALLGKHSVGRRLSSKKEKSTRVFAKKDGKSEGRTSHSATRDPRLNKKTREKKGEKRLQEQEDKRLFGGPKKGSH